jgi:hypothetical protein
LKKKVPKKAKRSQQPSVTVEVGEKINAILVDSEDPHFHGMQTGDEIKMPMVIPLDINEGNSIYLIISEIKFL